MSAENCSAKYNTYWYHKNLYIKMSSMMKQFHDWNRYKGDMAIF